MSSITDSYLHDLPELVRDSRKHATFRFEGSKYCTIHSRAASYRDKRGPEKWIYKKRLGGGGQGYVDLEAQDVTENGGTPQFRAVKRIEISKAPETAKLHRRELIAIFKFSQAKFSEYFVQSYGWFLSDTHIHIAMEYLEQGDLGRHLSDTNQCPNKRLPESDVCLITMQLLDALAIMHEEGFSHRDIKPANILIKQKPPMPWWIKLGDFGISKKSRDLTQVTDIRGTPSFLPPELILSRPTSEMSYSIDMWCLGETIFRALTGGAIFNSLYDLLNYSQGRTSFPQSFLSDLKTSENAIDFVSSLVAPDPAKRLTAGRAQVHKWIVGNATSAPESTGSHHFTPHLHQFDPEMESTEASAVWTDILSHSEPLPETGPKRADSPSTLADALFSASLTTSEQSQAIDLMSPTIPSSVQPERTEKTSKELLELASAHREQGQFLEAEKVYCDLLDTRKKTLGPDHQETKDILQALSEVRKEMSEVLMEASKFEEAQVVCQELVNFQTASFGEKHRDTISATSSLAVVLLVRGKYQEAEPILWRACELAFEQLGADDTITLGIMHQLGYIKMNAGEFDVAETCYRAAYYKRKLVLGSDHLDTFQSQADYAVALYMQDKVDEAVQILEDLLTRRKTTLGLDHRDTIRNMDRLAAYACKQNRFVDAERLYHEAISIARKALGNKDPDTLELIGDLGSMLLFNIPDENKKKESEPYLQESYNGQKEVLGARDPTTLRTLSGLSQVFSHILHNYSEATIYYRELYEANLQESGNSVPTVENLESLVICLYKQGRYSELEEEHKNLISLTEQVLGVNGSKFISAVALYGETLVQLHKKEEAVDVYLDAMSKMDQTSGDPHRLELEAKFAEFLQRDP